MPLTLLRKGQSGQITHIGGSQKTRQFLGNLGFVEGSLITVVSETGGNLIVHIKDTRVAISREMAMKISI